MKSGRHYGGFSTEGGFYLAFCDGFEGSKKRGDSIKRNDGFWQNMSKHMRGKPFFLKQTKGGSLASGLMVLQKHRKTHESEALFFEAKNKGFSCRRNGGSRQNIAKRMRVVRFSNRVL